MSLLGRNLAAAQKTKLGLIGCGWYGLVDLRAALKVGGVEVVALCDVDSQHLDCVRSREAPVCSPEDAFQSASTVQLAMIAYKSKSIVEWDAKTETILGDPPATSLLKREYRLPWRHSYTG